MTATNRSSSSTGGPLQGLRVLEISSIGPAPFGVMLLADMGAEVIRVDRPGGHAGNPVPAEFDTLNRSRRSILLNLKDPADLAVVKRLIERTDVLIEGFRPGVTERLGIGPQEALALNPRLVYGRMTGWGQDGPLSAHAGHDINYISVAGALDPIGHAAGGPVIPLNLLGDFGGGGTILAMGVLAAVLHSSRTGVGQVVDAAIVDGTAALTTMLHTFRSSGMWQDARGTNLLDGGAHFYRVYETSDGRYLSVGAIEPQFYERFIQGLGVPVEGDWATSHGDRSLWAGMTDRVAAIIREKPLQHWLEVFLDVDACVSPVLSPAEAIDSEYNVLRGTFIEVDGIAQPAPVPRFGVTPNPTPTRPIRPGEHSDEIRRELDAINP